ncbi:hypothetical protein FDZ71_13465, partial [bacterium]
VEILCHGSEHSRMGAPLKGENASAYMARIRDELYASREVLRREGFDPKWFTYPYGEFNETVLAEARAAGYALGFTQDAGAASQAQDKFAIPRFAVVGAVSDLGLFHERMGYEPLDLYEVSPKAGPVKGGVIQAVRARVKDPQKYKEGEVSVFVSEKGRLKASFDQATGLITAEGTAVKNRVNRIRVTLKNKTTGKWAFAAWIVINPENSN